MVQTSPEPSIDRWLGSVGFKFNPFVFLDAATDPYISAYLISNPAFATLWGEWPSLVLAPAGGGKTALRVQVSRACWAGPDIAHPFPISYVPIFDASGRYPTTEAEHLAAILRAGAQSLLAAIFFRPHWWASLSNDAQRQVHALLECDLPMPLWSYTSQLEETRTLAPLIPGLGAVGVVLAEPDPERWLPLCGELKDSGLASIPSSPHDRLNMLLSLLINDMGMSSVFLLVDGVDGFVETVSDRQEAMHLLAPLFASLESLSDYRLWFKGFLPQEISDDLGSVSPTLSSQVRQVEVRWQTPSLADIIRQRVYIATEGAYGSLDAICAPSLRDTETRLARVVTPLPREILMLTSRLLWVRALRADGARQLEMIDLETAMHWYEQQRLLG